MLCEKCKNKFGMSYKYLVKMVESYEGEESGIKPIKEKILGVLKEGSGEIYELQKRIEKLEEKFEKMVV